MQHFKHSEQMPSSKTKHEVANTAMLHENILDSMDNGVIALDFEGKIITFNAAAARILGISVESALGKYYPEVFFGQEGNDEFNDVLIHVIYTRQTHLYQEVQFVSEDGTVVPLGVNSSLLKDEHGTDYGVVSVFSDLSEIKQRQFLQETLTRYVTKQVVDLILEHPESIILDGEEREATVLFADIRSFTSLSEKMEPKEVVQMLREYFTRMVEAVFAFQGTVDKFIGDCIMAIFGAPSPQPNHAERAVRSALAMKKALTIFNTFRLQQEKDPIRIGIGINTGDMVVGNIGSEQRLEYTAIGDAVNLASRLEGITKQYGSEVVISESTACQLPEDVVTRELDKVRVKGKYQPVTIYEVLGTRDEISKALVSLQKWFVQGLVSYRKQSWETAIQEFQHAQQCVPGDNPSAIYIKRCTQYQQNPPPDAWDGVFEMITK